MKSLLLFLSIVLIQPQIGFPQPVEETVRLADLRGQWKFMTGDDPDWSAGTFDDSNWPEIFAPGAWEDEGYPGYDGYAWYRIHVKGSAKFERMQLKLEAGRIDDADQIWVNGILIGGTGGFPPNYYSAYNRYRSYPVPSGVFSTTGDNVIAIRVFDEKLLGGILEGRLAIYGTPLSSTSDLDLSGMWKFRTGDREDWKEPDLDDSDWQDLIVPMFWDAQGLARFDGIAWYRKTIFLEGDLTAKRFLKLGRIDDFDEVYVNGRLVGKTGVIPEEGEQAVFHNEYQQQRIYLIPEDMLLTGKNLIAVRVFDGGHDGGIYEGPVCLTTDGSGWTPGEESPDIVFIEQKAPWYIRLIEWIVDAVRWLFGRRG
jgi:sialate O-acetylesterase